MKKLFWFTLTCLCTYYFPNHAYSQSTSGTLGQTLANFISNVWQPFFLLIATLSAIAGIILVVRGLLRIVEISRQPFGYEGISTATISLGAGVLLLVLPDVAGIGMLTVLGEIQGGGTLGGSALDYNDRIDYQGNFLDQIFGGISNIEPVQTCINLNADSFNNSTNAVECMTRNLARNVIPIAIFILFALTFIIGFAGLAFNIIGLIIASQRQLRTSSILASMLVNVILMNVPFLFRIVANTLISPSSAVFTGQGLNSSSSLLTWTATDSSFQNWCDLFSHLTIILLFFGAFAFVRGVYMIKAVAETGHQRGSFSMASVYMIAGLFLANLKTILGILSGTLGISGQSFCF